jgi:hypothetical protein
LRPGNPIPVHAKELRRLETKLNAVRRALHRAREIVRAHLLADAHPAEQPAATIDVGTLEWFKKEISIVAAEAQQSELDRAVDRLRPGDKVAAQELLDDQRRRVRSRERFDHDMGRIYTALGSLENRQTACALLHRAAQEKAARSESEGPIAQRNRRKLRDLQCRAERRAKAGGESIQRELEAVEAAIELVIRQARIGHQEERPEFLQEGRWWRAWKQMVPLQQHVSQVLRLIRAGRVRARPGRRRTPQLNRAIVDIVDLLAPITGLPKAISEVAILLWLSGVGKTPASTGLRARYYQLRQELRQRM